MNKLLMLAMVAVLSGCSLFRSTGTGEPVKDVQVSVAQGRTLYDAVISAANRRKWAVAKNGDGSYRLSIIQRSNRCIVDVVLDGDKAFSIIPVESTIPVRKYDQWVDNLKREIIHRASM